MQCSVSMFWYMEHLKELNALQEGVIKNVEERLDKMQKDEQEKKGGEDRDRRRREEHRDRRRERSRSRERR